MDLLVKWDTDGSENIVNQEDIELHDGCQMIIGGRVKMWWLPGKKWWYGTIIMCEGPDTDNSSDEDNIPLSAIIKRASSVIYQEEDVEEYDDDDQDQDYIPSSSDEDGLDNSRAGRLICRCKVRGCKEEIFAACPRCLEMMCHDHFVKQCTFCRPENVACRQPENFAIEGMPREQSDNENSSPPKKLKMLVKEGRNKGISYTSEKSGNVVPARNQLKPRCNTNMCEKRGLLCDNLSEERRNAIIAAYYNIPTLTDKRKWIANFVIPATPFKLPTTDTISRKGRTIHYYLPEEKGELLPVCRVMFLATTGIAERQIRTTLEKMSNEGVVDEEKRGGRQKVLQDRDTAIRNICKSHLNRFPRAESHYCRSSSTFEYLSSDLSVSKMYDMFQTDIRRQDISFATYYRVFKQMNLKFIRPKKDMCGLCEGYRAGGEMEKSVLRERYVEHIAEKDASREIKDAIKHNNDPSHILASFDLQQVIYLPKTNRCEVFYRRRLSNYNFTICNIKSKMVNCYLWHESIAARGANEIASHVHHFLLQSDTIGHTKVSLFADGCSGQNKNSILPTMLLNFMTNSKYIQEITVHYFETSHGQNEGDAVHSTIERAIRKSFEIILPSQLSLLIRMARREPYCVYDVCTEDIFDWKALSQNIGVLRCRISEEGDQIDWKNIMELRVKKDQNMKLFFKLSHLQDEFSTLNLAGRRTSTLELELLPEKAYIAPPKVSVDKYADLVSLCSGDFPVIRSQEAKCFYLGLQH